MTRIALLALALSTFAACSKKKEDASAGTAAPAATAKTTEPAAAAPAAAPAAEPAADQPKAGAGPVKTDPKALFAEFTDPKVDGLALLDKYHDGATFSGKVTVKAHEENGTPVLWMMLDGGKHIDLGFADVAKAKAIKDGDTVTVTCKIGGAMDNLMQVLDCQ